MFGSGSLGLTLTQASVVVLFEPNDTFLQEAQAIDRAHRIGQQEEVDVIKFYLDQSVEGAVHDFYSHKARLHDVAIARNPHLVGNQERSEVLYDVDKLKCKTVLATDDYEIIQTKLVQVAFKQPVVAPEQEDFPRQVDHPSEKDSVLVSSKRRGAVEVEDEELKRGEMEQAEGQTEGQPMVVYVDFFF